MKHSRKPAASAPVIVKSEEFLRVKAVANTCKKLQYEIKKLGLRIKRHEDNIRSLMIEETVICGAVQDLRVTLSQFRVLERPMTEKVCVLNTKSDVLAVPRIVKHKNAAAGILSELTTSHGTKASNVLKNCGVVKIVATGNISREEPQIIFPECSGTLCPFADYASLEEKIRKKGLEWDALQEELQREVALLRNVKSMFLDKEQEYTQFLLKAPLCSGSDSSTEAKIEP